MQITLLTFKEIENLLEYCKEHNNKNIVLITTKNSVASVQEITTQDNFYSDEKRLTNITDYDSW